MSSSLTTPIGGHVLVTFSVRPELVGSSLSQTFLQINRLVDQAPTAAEVELGKLNQRSRFLGTFETPDLIADFLCVYIAHGVSPVDLQIRLAQIAAVTPDDVLAWSPRIFSMHHTVVVVVGHPDELTARTLEVVGLWPVQFHRGRALVSEAGTQ